jgi:HAD superfamily hydrolase (TIGR01490 family)
MGVNRVTLIGKPGCHLCDEMRKVIQIVVGDDFTELSILDDRELEAKYLIEIPVVLVDGKEVAMHQVSKEQLESALSGQKVAAFFDLDNTLIRGSSLFLLARGLKDYGYFTTNDFVKFFWKQLKFVVVGKESLGDQDRIKDLVLKIAAGHSLSKLEALADELLRTELLPKIYDQTLAIAKEHVSNGREVWLVTASPQRLAQLLAQTLGLTGAIGSQAVVVDDIFTGEILGKPIHGKVKAQEVEKLAKDRNFNLSKSFAYSDSCNDLPMLEMVGNPAVVNGDRKLRAIAKKRGWAIYDFRKMRHVRKYGIHALVAALLGLVARIFRRR